MIKKIDLNVVYKIKWLNTTIEEYNLMKKIKNIRKLK